MLRESSSLVEGCWCLTPTRWERVHEVRRQVLIDTMAAVEGAMILRALVMVVRASLGRAR